MDKRTSGIVATVAAVLLCGCPGLFGLCFGLVFAFVGMVPGSEINIGGRSDPGAAISTGLTLICFGLVFVIIPIVVGFLALRNRNKAGAVSFDEPVPPALLTLNIDPTELAVLSS